MKTVKHGRSRSFFAQACVRLWLSIANVAVLRSLRHFSHTTIISRHHTYRQAYTLIFTPFSGDLTPTPSNRSITGTTVNVKDLYANYPVRQLLSRSNSQSELKELTRISIGIRLSSSMALTLRNSAGQKIVKIGSYDGQDCEAYVLKTCLSCSLSRWMVFKDRLEEVHITLKICSANTSRNYSFVCVPFALEDLT